MKLFKPIDMSNPFFESMVPNPCLGLVMDFVNQQIIIGAGTHVMGMKYLGVVEHHCCCMETTSSNC